MSLFRKIFGLKNKQEDQIKSEERGKYMPDIKLPMDEKFTINFKANGGKFLYCENMEEIHKTLHNILKENNWEGKNVFLLDGRLNDLFRDFDLQVTRIPEESEYFLSTCEYLIADDGSLLISSNQIAEKKLGDLPPNFVIFATTSQFVDNIGEGLRGIKNNNKDRIPTNITTIKHFKAIEDKNFLSYGSSSKNLYLLLLEDL